MGLFNFSDQTDNQRACELFQQGQACVYKQTDRIFAILMPLQWLAGIIFALTLSPRTWNGVESRIHWHVWAAFFLGGIIAALPCGLALLCPGQPLTRHIIAVSQLLMSGLLVHLTEGRIETHFHIFGSLAFLSFYNDWRVLATATLVTTADHFLRGWFFPMSVYGILTGGEWRWMEHAGWIIFTDVCLLISCRQKRQEMWKSAQQNALLEERELRYRTVLEQAQEGIAFIEPQTHRVLECNAAFGRLFQCESLAAAKGSSVADLINADAAEIAWIESILLATGSYRGEYEISYRNGTRLPIEAGLSLINYGHQQLFFGIYKDITERKHAEAELRRLALIAQKIPNLVMVSDPQGDILWVNENFTRVTGYELHEAIGQKPSQLLQGEKTDPETIAAIRTAMAEQTPITGEICNYTKSGHPHWFLFSNYPFHNTKGELQGFISIKSDISERKAMEEELYRAHDELELRVAKRTEELLQVNQALQMEAAERKQAQQELSEAQAFLDNVINCIPHPIFVKDEFGTFRLVNSAFATLYGQKVEEMIGHSDYDYHSPSEAAIFLADDYQVLENQREKFIPEERHTDLQGRVRWVQTVKRPLVVGNKQTRYLLGISTDLTERHELEQQLRQAQKLESIGQLAAGIAHEINTPTQYVGDNTRFVQDSFRDLENVLNKFHELLEVVRTGQSASDLLVEVEQECKLADMEYLREEIPHALQQSLEGVNRIAKIVQSMKDFAHPGSNEMKAADINKAIESTITVARNEWKYVAELETYFDDSLPLVPCFLGEFNQVILNMTINAAHAIADVVGDGARGRGKITITTRNIANQWAEIRLSDTGTGIPLEVRNRIFDPFFTTKEVGKGTGQGLAISHNVIVEKHKGQLSFETEMGQGTTFIIRLPLS